MPLPKTRANPVLITRNELAELCGCSRTYTYHLEKEPGFPRRVVVGNLDRWFQAEVLAWIGNLPRRGMK